MHFDPHVLNLAAAADFVVGAWSRTPLRRRLDDLDDARAAELLLALRVLHGHALSRYAPRHEDDETVGVAGQAVAPGDDRFYSEDVGAHGERL